MTRISIVTPSFNQAPFLAEALESVRTQQYENLEHIVMDGASSDASVNILETCRGPQWKHLRWQSQKDRGQSDALNQGFRLAGGDIIGWLNSDDRYRPGCFAAIARAFADNPAIDIIYGDYTVIDADGRHLRLRREIEFSRFILLHHRILYVPTPSTFFRRKIFDDGNWLDESLHYAMDHEFFARLAMRGYRFKHLSAVLADFRLHPASKTCVLPARQLRESRLTMHKYSPFARRVKSPALRRLCFGLLQCGAALLRYTDKLLRGYYLPGRYARRSDPAPSIPAIASGSKPEFGEQ